MTSRNNTQAEEPIDKAVPIADPEVDSGDVTVVGQVKKRPYVLEKKRGSGDGKMPMMLIVFGAIVIFGIGMLAFLSTKGTPKGKTIANAAKPNLGRVVGPSAPGDLIPNDKVARATDEHKKSGTLDPGDIEKTKTPKVAQSPGITTSAANPAAKRLNQVGKFDESDTSPNAQSRWTPPSYPGGQNDQHAEKKEEDELAKPSLVFTAHRQNGGPTHKETQATVINNLGLEPGYHVAARLESMASTAVHAPVTAVIEYNYEREGQILIPAGSRAVGKIAQADPSGLMNISFSSIEFPTGDTVAIDAVASDMNLAAIKGKVTGKQTGKSLLVRSLAGIGETAAMLVGQPNGGNNAFSESDMVRMRLAENVGNAGDEQIMRMMTMQHIVVSVPAGTEIYLIFEKAPQTETTRPGNPIIVPHSEDTAIDTTASPQP